MCRSARTQANDLGRVDGGCHQKVQSFRFQVPLYTCSFTCMCDSLEVAAIFRDERTWEEHNPSKKARYLAENNTRDTLPAPAAEIPKGGVSSLYRISIDEHNHGINLVHKTTRER